MSFDQSAHDDVLLPYHSPALSRALNSPCRVTSRAASDIEVSLVTHQLPKPWAQKGPVLLCKQGGVTLSPKEGAPLPLRVSPVETLEGRGEQTRLARGLAGHRAELSNGLRQGGGLSRTDHGKEPPARSPPRACIQAPPLLAHALLLVLSW